MVTKQKTDVGKTGLFTNVKEYTYGSGNSFKSSYEGVVECWANDEILWAEKTNFIRLTRQRALADAIQFRSDIVDGNSTSVLNDQIFNNC